MPDEKFSETLNEFKTKKDNFQLGGGNAKIEKQHKDGKLTARERIEKLLDENSLKKSEFL